MATRWSEVDSARQFISQHAAAGSFEDEGPWTREEDALLIRLVQRYGPKKWSQIALHVPGRKGKQCRERFKNHLDTSVKKTPWTSDEDKILLEAQSKIGNRWCEISKLLDGRPENAVKNRWNSLMNKRWTRQIKKHRTAKKKSAPSSSSSSSSASQSSSSSSSAAAAQPLRPRWDTTMRRPQRHSRTYFQILRSRSRTVQIRCSCSKKKKTKTTRERKKKQKKLLGQSFVFDNEEDNAALQAGVSVAGSLCSRAECARRCQDEQGGSAASVMGPLALVGHSACCAGKQSPRIANDRRVPAPGNATLQPL